MCLGGPNHCRVGRAGSQSYFLVSLTYCRLIIVNCMQSLVVRLMSSCCVHRGLHLIRRRVAT
jgi:hypothetical protein